METLQIIGIILAAVIMSILNHSPTAEDAPAVNGGDT